ncbi:MAG: DUF4878 domain-containing protein [Ruminococcaceae bacterium]|nr:DUF4878 domain-containing protein [Oscillospiraceae bacterium]
MKKILKLIALLIIPVLLFSGCSGAKTPSKAVEEMFKNVKKLDFDKAKKHLLNEDIGIDKDSLKKLGAEGEIIKTILKNIEYKIVSVDSVDAQTSMVHVNVKSINIKQIMSDFVPIVLRHTVDSLSVLGDGKNNDPGKLITDDFNNLMKDKKYSNYERVVDIKVINVNGEWKIDLGESLMNLLYKDVNEMFDELEEELNRIQVKINE